MTLALLLAILVGAFLSVQAGINAQLGVALRQPAIAAICSFLVGTIGLIAFALITRSPLPNATLVAEAPWWTWAGGLLGAAYVVLAIILAPKLGAATLIALVVAGQMFSALILDQFGLVGFSVHPVNGWRLLGAALVVGGVVLIKRT